MVGSKAEVFRVCMLPGSLEPQESGAGAERLFVDGDAEVGGFMFDDTTGFMIEEAEAVVRYVAAWWTELLEAREAGRPGDDNS
eukprot:CAMPEP_0184295814 /NCGR_PEP_ID=MMETSP1049-20130417/6719_1 /TAXON_ID=77928 /ORGANISM="Proteomonas sulcata, Strain CCMP704" /LENGTH=82 /DNA_ID=CAMNT_0026604609 /DNA_START=790 /DNA_END=1035 /DNA_ORIENTATION=-